MAAVTVTTAHRPRSARVACAHRPTTAVARRAGARPPALVLAVRRTVAVALLVALLATVAVGTAAVGRVLDSHRGIPAVATG